MSGVWIEGMQEAQAAANKALAAVQPNGGFESAVKQAVMDAQGGVERRVHVVTGTYKASVRGMAGGLHGQVYIDSNAVNPVSGGRPVAYGPVEENRGGDHAAFYRTVTEDSQMLNDGIGRAFAASLP